MMSLNNVEKSLANVNIALRDSANSFRPLEDVIADVGARWEEFDEVQQAQIANSIAGVRQSQVFLSLMNNWGDVAGYVAEQTDSAGLAQDRYAIYLKSVEAAQNRVTASWEGLWQETLQSGAITWFYDFGAGILDAITKLGGLAPILSTVISLLVIFNAKMIVTSIVTFIGNIQAAGLNLLAFGKDMKAMITLMIESKSVMAGLNATFSATTLTAGALVLALASVIMVAKEYNEQIRQVQEAGLQENVNAWTKGFENADEQIESSIGVLERYRQKVDEVNQIYEDAEWYVKPFIDKQEILKNGFSETANELAKTSKTYDEYVSSLKEAADEIGYQVDAEGNLYRIYRGGGGLRKDYIEDVQVMSEENFNLRDSLDEVSNSGEDNLSWIEEAQVAYTSLGETLGGLTDQSKTLNDLISNLDGGTILDFDQLDELASAYPEYLDAITVENGQLKLNTDMIREYIAAKADQAVADAQAAGATEQEIAILQEYANQLHAQQEVLINGMSVTSQQADQIFWSIANEAAMSGNSFVDLQGKALNSAEAIYSFLQSGDSAFNSFVQQAANTTGMSVQQITQAINGMITSTYNSTLAMIQSLGNSMEGIYAMQGYLASGGSTAPPPVPSLGIFTPAPVGQQFPGGLSGGNSGGGSSGGSGSEDNSEEEKQKKIQKKIDNARKKAIEDLRKQLDVYGDIIDKRKELLDTYKEERDYQRDVEDQQAEILKVQNELAALQFDTSDEAAARRLELEDELSNLQRDLEDTQYEHSVEVQKQALDDLYESFQTSVEDAISQIQNIDASTLKQFNKKLAEILAGITLPSLPGEEPTMHEGGIVGANSGVLKSNELFVKMMKGEGAFTPEQMNRFMTKTLPEIAGTSSSTGMSIDTLMEFNVSGNLDKSVLPDINKIADKVIARLNSALLSRGYNRRADIFGQ